MSALGPALSGGRTGLRARETTEVTAGLRRAWRMTSVPTNPVAPVTMSFILIFEYLFLQKLLDIEVKERKEMLRL
jgi:hypothetical protein